MRAAQTGLVETIDGCEFTGATAGNGSYILFTAGASTDELTVNAGLRWDIMVPFTENHNYIVFLNETAPDPGAANLPGAASRFGTCTGCAGYNRAAIDWKQFGPRLGISYQLNDKTVLRSGASARMRRVAA